MAAETGAHPNRTRQSSVAKQAAAETPDETFLRQAIAVYPDNPVLHNNLAVVLRQQGRVAESVAVYGRTLQLDPEFSDAHRNLGVALRQKGSLSEAVASFERALTLTPADVQAWCELGGVLRELGQAEDAANAFRQALRHDPGCAEAHFALGGALLESGNYREGFAEQEWRWQWTGFRTPRRHRRRRRWDGCPLRGRRVLLCAEQGLGDTLQFVRFLPRVAAAGGSVALECQPELVPLLRHAELADVVVETGQPTGFDFYLPLLSLPHVLGIRTEKMIPAEVPYLRIAPEWTAPWDRRLERRAGPSVGLVWAGNPAHPRDRWRSIPLTVLEPLLRVPHVQFISLQKGAPAAQLEATTARQPIQDAGGELSDFADTAGLLACLDLLITVDTSVAHLAGALGRPVWLLLPYAADWRWLRNRSDSPWYPTARLFRQSSLGEWTSVVEEVIAGLRELS